MVVTDYWFLWVVCTHNYIPPPQLLLLPTCALATTILGLLTGSSFCLASTQYVESGWQWWESYISRSSSVVQCDQVCQQAEDDDEERLVLQEHMWTVLMKIIQARIQTDKFWKKWNFPRDKFMQWMWWWWWWLLLILECLLRTVCSQLVRV